MRFKQGHQAGFTISELLIVIAITGVVAATALPGITRTMADFRLRGDARSLHNLLGVAKMRAAAKYTKTRVYVDLTTKTFYLQTWDKPTNTWVTEGATTSLSTNVDFAFDALATPPPFTQPALQQAVDCLDDAGADIANTACVVFNSRGIPIDPTTGNPDGNGGFYLTDHTTGVYGITISMTPLVRLWWTALSNDGGWVQK
ncbi:MAG TPA: prepilin-type N-terminal cleavage/methylation domain-containing protein [Vicinamibacterales bacterium]